VIGFGLNYYGQVNGRNLQNSQDIVFSPQIIPFFRNKVNIMVKCKRAHSVCVCKNKNMFEIYEWGYKFPEIMKTAELSVTKNNSWNI
jgi:hypothetical protein